MNGWVRQVGLVGRSGWSVGRCTLGARSYVVGARLRYFSHWSRINSDVLVGNVCYVITLITWSSVCLYIVYLRTFYYLHRFRLKPTASR